LATSVVQLPAALAQERHGVVHAFAQQVPSTQKPLAHWVAPVHAWPRSNLQAPLASQVLLPLQVLSSPLVTSVVQVPAALAHERHGVVQASAQQVPSTQLPLRHSAAAPQA
jgi:RIO-like serine/threonine protein kinase